MADSLCLVSLQDSSDDNVSHNAPLVSVDFAVGYQYTLLCTKANHNNIGELMWV